MTRLDSDIMGIIFALLTFLVPVISAILEKSRKKGKGKVKDILPDEEPLENQPEQQKQQMSDIEEMFNQLLGLDSEGSANVYREDYEPVHSEPAMPVQQKDVVEDTFVEETFEEATPQTADLQVDPVEADTPVNEETRVKKRLGERLKENPADMVIFAEIMNPKYKEL